MGRRGRVRVHFEVEVHLGFHTAGGDAQTGGRGNGSVRATKLNSGRGRPSRSLESSDPDASQARGSSLGVCWERILMSGYR